MHFKLDLPFSSSNHEDFGIRSWHHLANTLEFGSSLMILGCAFGLKNN